MRLFSRSLAVQAAAIALIAIAAMGCAHRPPPAPRSEPPVTQRAQEPAAPDTVSDSPSFDPSEVITAEELATIPDPVPGAPAEPPIDPTPPPPVEVPGAAGDDGAAWIWRVQVFASPDRTQAERAAREASERLGQPHVLDREDSLYKVRLGAFRSESDAEPLKRRAVLEGYAGAFRVRTPAP